MRFLENSVFYDPTGPGNPQRGSDRRCSVRPHHSGGPPKFSSSQLCRRPCGL
ncbi:hypothetical protein RchiOBHm_Chr2g0165401 [Rosa chinensis]|uniref:Uncharacterized protein n=1 Tax=Rosa chinensis TaxID=74649 RepID=A0A2P6S3U3_ROSCH|nr:hypothetical protein RchiOBHm_Chr2g0165401 [Rosa chinensis]